MSRAAVYTPGGAVASLARCVGTWYRHLHCLHCSEHCPPTFVSMRVRKVAGASLLFTFQFVMNGAWYYCTWHLHSGRVLWPRIFLAAVYDIGPYVEERLDVGYFQLRFYKLFYCCEV